MILKFATSATLFLIAGAAIVGWARFGTDILLDTASAGLSWCF